MNNTNVKPVFIKIVFVLLALPLFCNVTALQAAGAGGPEDYGLRAESLMCLLGQSDHDKSVLPGIVEQLDYLIRGYKKGELDPSVLVSVQVLIVTNYTRIKDLDDWCRDSKQKNIKNIPRCLIDLWARGLFQKDIDDIKKVYCDLKQAKVSDKFIADLGIALCKKCDCNELLVFKKEAIEKIFLLKSETIAVPLRSGPSRRILPLSLNYTPPAKSGGGNQIFVGDEGFSGPTNGGKRDARASFGGGAAGRKSKRENEDIAQEFIKFLKDFGGLSSYTSSMLRTIVQTLGFVVGCSKEGTLDDTFLVSIQTLIVENHTLNKALEVWCRDHGRQNILTYFTKFGVSSLSQQSMVGAGNCLGRGAAGGGAAVAATMSAEQMRLEVYNEIVRLAGGGDTQGFSEGREPDYGGFRRCDDCSRGGLAGGGAAVAALMSAEQNVHQELPALPAITRREDIAGKSIDELYAFLKLHKISKEQKQQIFSLIAPRDIPELINHCPLMKLLGCDLVDFVPLSFDAFLSNYMNRKERNVESALKYAREVLRKHPGFLFNLRSLDSALGIQELQDLGVFMENT